MKRKLGWSGYTIVEVLMFLVVSGAMLGSVMALISGQQAKNEFTIAMRDLESRVQDVLNDVSTGNYASPGNITCTAAAGGPPVATIGGSIEQGRNNECIFAGRVFQFSGAGSNGQLNSYTIMGRRTIEEAGKPDRPVANIDEAQPRLLDAPDGYTLSSGLEFKKVLIGSTETYGVAFIASFGQVNDDQAGIVTGSSGTSLMKLLLARGADTASLATAVSSLNSTSTLGNDTVTLCVGDPGSGGRLGAVLINGRGTEILFDNDVPAGCTS